MSKITSDIVKGYLKKFPNSTKTSLSKKIYEENEHLFKDAEQARSLIRIYTGSNGNKDRANIKDTTFYSNPHNPFDLPEPEFEEWTPFILPKAANNILKIADIHIPYHDIKAINSALTYGKEQDVNTILINGDLLDCYSVSDFHKNPSKPSIREEFKLGRQFLESLQKHFPKTKIYFKEGNHEERWERMLLTKAPAIFDMEEFKIDVILKLGEMGIEYIKDRRIIKAGKLNILHGHELQKGMIAPVNVARGAYLKAKVNLAVDHSHVTSEHTEPNLNGEIVTCFSSGCLCNLFPDYARINKYNHGFSGIKVESDGKFVFNNFRVINGKRV